MKKDLSAWIEGISFYDNEKFDRVRVLLYGPTGVGKTLLAGTFPKPFFIDTDKGGRTLKDTKIPFISLERGERIFDVIMDVIRRCKAKESPFHEIKVETLVFDSLTSLAEALLIEAMLYPGGGRPPKDPNRQKPDWDDYSMLLNRMKTMVKASQDLPTNVVATCGSKLDRDEVLGSFVGEPSIVGGYRGLVSYDFDEVYFMDTDTTKDGTKYFTYTTKYRYYEAKSRTGQVPRFENATYEKLFGGKE